MAQEWAAREWVKAATAECTNDWNRKVVGSPHSLDLQAVGCWHRNQRHPIMNQNHTDGWMHGWSDGWMGGSTGGGAWILPVIGIVIVILLVVVISKLSKK